MSTVRRNKIKLLLLIMITQICTKETEDMKIDNMLKWYNKRSQEAAEYKYPTDARMYEAEDKTLIGENGRLSDQITPKNSFLSSNLNSI